MKIIGSSPKYIEYWNKSLTVDTKSQKLIFGESITDYILVTLTVVLLVGGVFLPGPYLMYAVLSIVCFTLACSKTFHKHLGSDNRLFYSKNNIKHIDIKLEDGFMKNLIKFKDGEWVQTQSELGVVGKLEYKVLSEWGNIKSTKQL